MILHGFAQMALTQEDIIINRCNGNSLLLKEFDIRFIAPFVLPGNMLVYINDVTSSVYVTNENTNVVILIGTFILNVGMNVGMNGNIAKLWEYIYYMHVYYACVCMYRNMHMQRVDL